jgi:methionine-rich copper-binding protein CopC
MTNKKKQPSEEIKAESNNKNIFLFIVLILISGTAAFYLINNKPAEKKQIFDVDSLEEISTNDSIVASDSIVAIENTNLDHLENEDLKVLTTKKKPSRFSIENNPKYWTVVKGSNSDTTFYTLKNKKTGTKLSNKFYDKEKANLELKILRSILSK